MKRRNFIRLAALTSVGAGLASYFWPNRWRYIVIHHSGGTFGDLEFLKKVHRERQPSDPVDAIPYHYLIGNGKGLGDGEVASGWRTRYHLWGAHVSGRNIDRNFRGIGICLIGNLEEEAMSPGQYAALVSLTRELMTRHQISADRVSGHGMTPGESTLCPGKFFPIDSFNRDIAAT